MGGWWGIVCLIPVVPQLVQCSAAPLPSLGDLYTWAAAVRLLGSSAVQCVRNAHRRRTSALRPAFLPRPAVAVDENRRSALHFAAAMGKAALVERLLKAGGEVDLADKEGE